MTRPTPDEIVAAITTLARLIAAEQLDAARTTDAEWVSLASLGLGRKRGPEMCRRWIAAGRGGVISIGREWRVHRDTVHELLSSAPTAKPRPAPQPDVMDRIRDRLRVVGGAG